MKKIFCLIIAFLLMFAGCGKGESVVEDMGDKTAYALILNNEADADNVNPMVFIRSGKEIAVGDTYDSDVFGKLEVLYVYTGFDTDVYLGQDDPRGFIKSKWADNVRPSCLYDAQSLWNRAQSGCVGLLPNRQSRIVSADSALICRPPWP